MFIFRIVEMQCLHLVSVPGNTFRLLRWYRRMSHSCWRLNVYIQLCAIERWFQKNWLFSSFVLQRNNCVYWCHQILTVFESEMVAFWSLFLGCITISQFIKTSLHVVFISFYAPAMLLDRDIYLLNKLRAVNVELNIRWLFLKIISYECIWSVSCVTHQEWNCMALVLRLVFLTTQYSLLWGITHWTFKLGILWKSRRSVHVHFPFNKSCLVSRVLCKFKVWNVWRLILNRIIYNFFCLQ